MTGDRFFRGFFSALRRAGVTHVSVYRNEHHRLFREAVGSVPHGDGVPFFMASPFTGCYLDLDRALLMHCLFGEGSYLPAARTVDLGLSQERAAGVLEGYSCQDLALLETAAAAWVKNLQGACYKKVV